MKKVVTVAVMLAVALLAFGCTTKRDFPYDPRNGLHHNEITAFSFAAPVSVAIISATPIAVTVPYGRNVTALVATFSTTGQSVSVSGSAQTSGVNANNFTNPVTYTVTVADGSTQDYYVTAPPSTRTLAASSFTTGSSYPAGWR
jgi:hypothetical protein